MPRTRYSAYQLPEAVQVFTTLSCQFRVPTTLLCIMLYVCLRLTFRTENVVVVVVVVVVDNSENVVVVLNSNK